MAVMIRYRFDRKRINRTFLKGIVPGEICTINDAAGYANLRHIEALGILVKVESDCTEPDIFFARVRDSVIGERS